MTCIEEERVASFLSFNQLKCRVFSSSVYAIKTALLSVSDPMHSKFCQGSFVNTFAQSTLLFPSILPADAVKRPSRPKVVCHKAPQSCRLSFAMASYQLTFFLDIHESSRVKYIWRSCWTCKSDAVVVCKQGWGMGG